MCAGPTSRTDLHYRGLGRSGRRGLLFLSRRLWRSGCDASAAAPPADYELSELIILTPQMAFPLDVIPNPTAELLFLDGAVERLSFPLRHEGDGSGQLPFGLTPVKELRPEPRVYPVFDHKDDATAAIYFNPGDTATPFAFPHFLRTVKSSLLRIGGAHWPLSRGNTTGGAIDDRICVSPAHSSLMTWGVPSMGNALPKPLLTGERKLLDAVGHSREITIQRWARLIARTDAQRDDLVAWAHCFGLATGDRGQRREDRFPFIRPGAAGDAAGRGVPIDRGHRQAGGLMRKPGV